MFTLNNSFKTMVSAQEALDKLMEGTKRFTSDQDQHPRNDSSRRQELKEAQHPFAVVLCCADSRVSPELIFDQGLGDIFEVEVAGNVLDKAVLGSLEYPVAHLETKLILVMGHKSCGAVGAAVKGEKDGSHIDYFVDAIAPAVAQAKEMEGDLGDNALRANAKQVAERLKNDSAFKDVEGLQIVPAYYNIESGEVSLLQ